MRIFFFYLKNSSILFVNISGTRHSAGRPLKSNLGLLDGEEAEQACSTTGIVNVTNILEKCLLFKKMCMLCTLGMERLKT